MKQSLLLFVLLSFALSSAADQSILLDGHAGGKRFDGLGAVSGGGATSVLLKDYPEPQRSQILDLLFKPNFGASMSALLVEIPGDGNSTQGSELSHMHSRDDQNYNRGYEWWLMREAKRRNSDITLDGVAWGCPGWVGDGNFWSQDMCDYYVKWVQGLKRVYGLDLDAIGCRNERGINIDFVKKLRRTLNQNGWERVKIHAFDNWGKSKWDWCSQLETDPELREAVDILGNHTMSEVPTPEAVKQIAAKYKKPIWNTEEHVYRAGFDCEISLVHVFNQNYISNDVTKVVCWYLISALYPIEPYNNVTVMVADSPWSGHYSVNPALWAYAHYGQFCKVGWKYLDGACTNLNEGGSVVTLTDGGDFSAIVETKDAKITQTLKFKLSGGLSEKTLCFWRSNAKEQFVRQPDIVPLAGEFSVVLEPNAIYSISTTAGQQKGSFENVPDAAPFPFPYHETFDEYTNAAWWGYEPLYTADICGAFEIADRPDGQGKCLRQMLNRKAQNWGPEWMPYTIIGNRDWRNYEVAADIYLDNDGWAGVMGRVNSTGGGWGCNPKGYYVRLQTNGLVALYVANDSHNGTPGTPLTSTILPDFSAKGWHNLKLRFADTSLTVLLNNKEVLFTNDSTYSKGMAGLVTGGEKDARNTALFDNLTFNAAGKSEETNPAVTQTVVPMYQPQKEIIIKPNIILHRTSTNTTITGASVQNLSIPAKLAESHVGNFTTGSMSTKQAWDLATASINAGDFDNALSILIDMRKQTDLTREQISALNEIIGAIEKVAKGNPGH